MTNTENAGTHFEEILSNEIKVNIPRSRRKKRRPYINREAERKMKKKYYLSKKLKETYLGREHDKCKKERKTLCVLTRKLQKDFEKI